MQESHGFYDLNQYKIIYNIVNIIYTKSLNIYKILYYSLYYKLLE